MNNVTGLQPALRGRLPHLGMLRFAGPDAAAFLQGQVSNDTTRLARGEPLLAAYSNPQGRVLAVVHLLPHSGGIIAVLPRELVQPTRERLRKYVLRAKVNIEDLGDEWAVFGMTGSGDAWGALIPPRPDGARGYAERDGIGIAAVGLGAKRHWVIGARRDLEQRDADLQVDFERGWRLADIREGMPQIYAATCESFVAQMLNLDLIDGISFTKGCFTGQEIIARTQHLGRIKRRMFRLRLPPGPWSVGDAVRLADGRGGRLTEVASVEAHAEALAVLTLAPADGDATAGDGEPGTAVDAALLPLPYSVGAAEIG